MKMYVKLYRNQRHARESAHFLFEICSLVDFRIGKRWPWAMYGSFPIWKSTNERFPNRKWSPWAIHGSFPIWKSIKIVFQIGNEHHARYMANFLFEKSVQDLGFACSGPAGRARWSPGIGHGREIFPYGTSSHTHGYTIDFINPDWHLFGEKNASTFFSWKKGHLMEREDAQISAPARAP